MTTELATIPAAPVITDREIDSLFRVAKALAMSGLFKDTRQAEQAFAKVLIGRDLGLSPTQAMMGIDLIQGKPELSANLQASFVRRYRGPSGEKYDFRFTDKSPQNVTLEFFRDEGNGWESLGTSSFSMEDAKRAELAGKDMYRKFPVNMLFARAMTNGVAMFCPEVNGGIRVYSEGEISGEDQPRSLPDDGPTLEAVLPPLPVANVEDPEPVSDVPSADFFNPPPDGEVGGDYDPDLQFEDDPDRVDEQTVLLIAAELKRTGVKASELRDMVRAAGAGDLADAPLRSREDVLGMLGGLSEAGAAGLMTAIIDRNQAAA